MINRYKAANNKNVSLKARFKIKTKRFLKRNQTLL